MWEILIFDTVAALFMGMGIAGLINLRWLRRLPSLEELAAAGRELPAEKPARCSVVIAARDEAARIEQTLHRLLAQRGVEAEIIVVDDRSTDGTGDIVSRIAKDNVRVQVKRVEVLPEDWLGKCHACHIGASAATGDWILFTDADCWLKPDVIARAICLAERERADHVTLTSGVAVPSVGLRAGSVMFHLSLANWFSGVNRDRPKSHLGIGAFNLVRAAAYRQSGGYEALRLTVLDDVKLGLLLRRAGKRTRAFLGAEDVEAQWGTKLWDVIKLMEKNYFAALDYRVSLALGVGTFIPLLLAGAALGAVSGTAAGFAAALSPFCLSVPSAILARRLGWSWSLALVVPFVLPVCVCALLNSMFKTLRNGGIRWRDTFYPLATLRAGNIQ